MLSTLEVISCEPDAGNTLVPRVTLLAVHGAWGGAWCWRENFLPYFAEHGISAHAVSLRGHGASAGSHTLRATRLGQYVDDVAEVARQLPTPPILLGHSMGGSVVQEFLARGEPA